MVVVSGGEKALRKAVCQMFSVESIWLIFAWYFVNAAFHNHKEWGIDFANPFVWFGFVGAALAIPVALLGGLLWELIGKKIVWFSSRWSGRVVVFATLTMAWIYANAAASEVLNEVFYENPSVFPNSKVILTAAYMPLAFIYHAGQYGFLVCFLLGLPLSVTAIALCYTWLRAILPFDMWWMAKEWLLNKVQQVLWVTAVLWMCSVTYQNFWENRNQLVFKVAVFADFYENHECLNALGVRVLFLSDDEIMVPFFSDSKSFASKTVCKRVAIQ